MTTKCQAFRVAAADAKNLQSNRQSSTTFFTFSTQQAICQKSQDVSNCSLQRKKRDSRYCPSEPFFLSAWDSFNNLRASLHIPDDMISKASECLSSSNIHVEMGQTEMKQNCGKHQPYYLCSKHKFMQRYDRIHGFCTNTKYHAHIFLGNTSLSIWLLLYSLDTLPNCLNITILIEAWNWCR
jgi:hypothetical protein